MRASQGSRWQHDPSYGPVSVCIRGVDLLPINPDGSPAERVGFIAQQPQEALAATVKLYERTGFVRPWISYLATSGPLIVGICAFAAPPKKRGRVEIAYHTFKPFEGQGIATMMVSELVKIARTADPDMEVFAQTVAQGNASNATLRKVGFEFVGEFPHTEVGRVWEWRLSPVKKAEANPQLELF
jgi:ribosomal-protein-alanine N-acetyltransferase